MKTLILNVLAAVTGLLAAFGLKPDLTPDQIAQAVGLLTTIVAIVNQVVHHTKTKKGRATAEALRQAQATQHHTNARKGKR